MTAYVPTNWVNNVAPALSAANLNKLTDELKSQALAQSISHALPTWVNDAPPALSDAIPMNELERVTYQVALSLGLTFSGTNWEDGWVPARNATRLNLLEQGAAANRTAIDTVVPPGGGNLIQTYTNSTPTMNGIHCPSSLSGGFIQPPRDFTVSDGIGGVTAVSTIHGPGFKFVVTPASVASWDASLKDHLCMHPSTNPLGFTERWEWYHYLPSQTLPNEWRSGTIWEFHTNVSSGHNLALDHDYGTYRFVVQNGAGQTYEFLRGPGYPNITYNAWTKVVFEIKWSNTTTGYVKWFINDLVNPALSRTNVRTYWDSGAPYLQFGWYSYGPGTGANEITFADIHWSRI